MRFLAVVLLAASPATAGELFFVGTRDSGFQLRLRGLVQADGRDYWGQDPNPQSTFLIRRARPYIEGTVSEIVDFRLMADFGQGNVQLLEAWLNLRPFAWLQLVAGKMKSPFGLERLQTDQFLTFVERGLPSNLAPDRDIGANLHGDIGVVEWDLGVFNGAPDGASVDFDANYGKDVIARAFVHPLQRTTPKARLGVGMAVTWGRQRGNAGAPQLPTYKTAGQQTFFSYVSDAKDTANTAFAAGDRLRLAPQLDFYAGPFGLVGEYIWTSQDVATGNLAPVRLQHQSFQLAATLVLTLERASRDGVVPRRPLDLKRLRQGYVGAFELGARYEELHADIAAFPRLADPSKSARAARAFGVELNWWMTTALKLAFLFERTWFEGGAGTATRVADKAAENVLIGRVQLAF
jgi:phosphate-selective porin OprO/OprP